MTGYSEVTVSEIIIDERYQQREELYSPATVDRYADLMREGVVFPPIVVFTTTEGLCLVDGFQRVHAAQRAGVTVLAAEVRTGTERDALLHSTGANSTHGLQPSAADKRKAVTLLILDPEWTQWSDREIARHAGVSNKLVSAVRQQLVSIGDVPDRVEVKVIRRGNVHIAKVKPAVAESPEGRMIDRLIQRVGGIDNLVNILVAEYGACVSGNRGVSVSGNREVAA